MKNNVFLRGFNSLATSIFFQIRDLAIISFGVCVFALLPFACIQYLNYTKELNISHDWLWYYGSYFAIGIAIWFTLDVCNWLSKFNKNLIAANNPIFLNNLKQIDCELIPFLGVRTSNGKIIISPESFIYEQDLFRQSCAVVIWPIIPIMIPVLIYKKINTDPDQTYSAQNLFDQYHTAIHKESFDSAMQNYVITKIVMNNFRLHKFKNYYSLLYDVRNYCERVNAGNLDLALLSEPIEIDKFYKDFTHSYIDDKAA